MSVESRQKTDISRQMTEVEQLADQYGLTLCVECGKCVSVCPMVVALSGAFIGEVPPYMCAIQKIRIAERQKFHEEIL